MNFKKYSTSDNQWHDIPYYTHKTATDTITTLPAVIYPNASTVTVGLKGNTVQNGTPTPQNPVDVNGCGERTGNLAQWEKGAISITTGADEAYRTAEQGGMCEQLRSLYIPCYGNADYVLHTNHYPVQTFISYYDADKNYISRSSGTNQSENRVFTTPETARYMRAQLVHVVTGQVYPAIEENQQYAITFGGTALPYEPYGYKIPISCGGTTNNVYLGEVESTRLVKKLVFNGSEPWIFSGDIIYINNKDTERLSPLMCTHFPNVQNTGMWNGNNWIFQVNISNLGMRGRDAWITYLQQQYANGTPVTVWYVLATPQTAIVNEPLMKIGTYADSLTTSIPCTAGSNTLDVQTTVQPSEITAGFSGWHPVSAAHERSGGAWD